MTQPYYDPQPLRPAGRPLREVADLEMTPPVNHLLHLILTLITLGLWAPVWLAVFTRNHDLRVAAYWKAKGGMPISH